MILIYTKKIIKSLFNFVQLVTKLRYAFNTYHVWIIEGNEKNSGEKVSLFFSGQEINKNYFVQIMFADYEEIYLGDVTIWKLYLLYKKHSDTCSMAVIVIRREFRRFIKRMNAFYIPCWIQMEMDISEPDKLFRHNRDVKNDIRRIRKNELSYEILDCRRHVDHFYRDMYLPYIQKSYADTAVLWDYRNWNDEMYDKHFLFLIKKGEEYISGNIIFMGSRYPELLQVGVKYGDEDYVKMGAIQATYYFPIQYFSGKGYKRINLGSSRSFLNDGPLQYKKKWAPEIIEVSERGFFVKTLKRSAGTDGFLINNPFFYASGKEINTALFIHDSMTACSTTINSEIRKKYMFKGISQLIVFQCNGNKILTFSDV